MAVKGGDLFAKALGSIQKKISGGQKLTVGFYAGSTEDDGTPVATVAYINEFGGGNVPPRPFFRSMIAKESPTWGKKFAKILKSNDVDVTTGMKLLGEGVKDQLVQSIVEFSDPANAASTIEAKGFDKPLVDTGTMQRSVGYEVEE